MVTNELIDFFEEKTNCDIKVSASQITFFPLQAEFKNLTFKAPGETSAKLKAEKLSIKLRFNDLFKAKVSLYDLEIDGLQLVSQNIFSSFFRLINFIIEPKDDLFWDVNLNNLTISNSKEVQFYLGENVIQAQGLTFSLNDYGNSAEPYTNTFSAEQLIVQIPDYNFNLGSFSGVGKFLKNYFLLEKAEFRSLASVYLTSQGILNYNLDNLYALENSLELDTAQMTKIFGLQFVPEITAEEKPWAKLKSSLSIKGAYNFPEITGAGQLDCAPERQEFNIFDEKYIIYNNLNFNYEFSDSLLTLTGKNKTNDEISLQVDLINKYALGTLQLQLTNFGRLLGSFEIENFEFLRAKLVSSDIKLEQFKIWHTYLPNLNGQAKLDLDLTGSLVAPEIKAILKGQTSFQDLSGTNKNWAADISYADKLLEIKSTWFNDQTTLDSTIDFSKENFSIFSKFSEFSILPFLPNKWLDSSKGSGGTYREDYAEKGFFSGNFQYQANFDAPLAGLGVLQLDSLVGIGKEEFFIEEKSPLKINFDGSKIIFSSVRLVHKGAELILSGLFDRILGWNAKLTGKWKIDDIIFPFALLEQITGDVKVDLYIKGAATKPVLTGAVSIQNGIFSLRFKDKVLGVRNVELEGEFADGNFTIKKMSGRYGNRIVIATGCVNNIFDVKKISYQLNLLFSELFFEINKNSNLVLDGYLTLLKEVNRPYLLKGALKVLHATYEESIDIVSLFELLKNVIQGKSNSIMTDNYLGAIGDDLELDLNIYADNNIKVATTFLNAELMGNLFITGSAKYPKIAGEISAVEGVYGSLNTSFDILTGKVKFFESKNYTDAHLSIIGETQVLTAALERSQVRMVVGGTLFDPRIDFVSNTGLSNNQLASLIGFDAELNTSRNRNEQNSIWLRNAEDNKKDSLFGSRLTDLIGLSSVSFGYGPSVVTGELVTKVSTGRQITDNLSVDLSNEFIEQDYVNLTFNYWLNSDWSIKAGWQNYYVTKEIDDRATALFTGILFKSNYPALGLLYRVWRDKELVAEPIITKVEFRGNWEINDRVLRRASNIKIGYPVSQTDLILAKQLIIEEYKKAGYFETTLQAEIKERYVPTQLRAIFNIDEGTQAKIKNIYLNHALDGLPKVKQIIDNYLDQRADQITLRKLRQEILLTLRNDGYLMASLWQEALPYNVETKTVDLQLSLELGERVRLELEGNKYFDKDKLLEPLHIKDRNVPFSRNVLLTLASEITALYKSQGFYSVEVTINEIISNNLEDVYTIQINEGEVWILGDVSIEGNTQIQTKQLLSLIKQKKGDKFNELQWQEDLSAIEAFYHSAGYREVVVKSNFLQNQIDKNIIVQVEIQEGSCSLIKSVQYYWANLALENDFNNSEAGKEFFKTAIKADTVNNLDAINSERNKLQGILDDLGYNKTDVVFEISKSGELNYYISADNIRYVGEIQIRGDGYTKESVIRREILLQSGDRFSQHKLLASELALYKLGVFSSVSTSTVDNPMRTDVVDIIVELKARDTLNLWVGAGYNTEDGWTLFGEIAEENVGGSADTLALGFETYLYNGDEFFNAGRANLTHIDRYFLRTKVRQTSRVYWNSVKDYNSKYSYYRYGSGLKYDYNMYENLNLSLGFDYYNEKVYDVEADLIFSASDNSWTHYSVFSASVIFDLRDNIFNTHQGSMSQLNLKYSPPDLFANLGFYELQAKHNFYFPVATQLTLVNKFDFSLINMVNSSASVPLTHRKFLGGRNSLRGYEPNTIGPVGYLGNVVGGDTSFVYNLELQYDLTKNLMLMTFFDMGTAFLRNENGFRGDPFNFYDLKYSPGVGFSYRTPIGPLGITWAKPIGKDYSHNASGYFILGITSSF
jgi:outer membrane protein insertion porin family